MTVGKCRPFFYDLSIDATRPDGRGSRMEASEAMIENTSNMMAAVIRMIDPNVPRGDRAPTRVLGQHLR